MRLPVASITFVALLPGLAAAEAHSEFLTCVGPGFSLEVERAPGVCYVDGSDVRSVSDTPTVCHISNPQLRILTIAEDLSFTYEDTDDDRVIRGTCR